MFTIPLASVNLRNNGPNAAACLDIVFDKAQVEGPQRVQVMLDNFAAAMLRQKTCMYRFEFERQKLEWRE